VFSVTKSDSLEESKWCVDLAAEFNIPFILISSGADFHSPRAITSDQADPFAVASKALCDLELSAKWDDCVQAILAQIEVAVPSIQLAPVAVILEPAPAPSSGSTSGSCC
jgi:hypothetical protein